jgi:hypothetical protein
MGRLDVHIRHGGSGGDGLAALVIAAVIAAALIRAAWGTITAAFHVILTALEVIAWTLAGATMAAVLAGGVLAGLRIRNAVRVARARRAAVSAPRPVVTITPEGHVRPLALEEDRPAIEAPRSALSAGWPLPGWWDEIRPRIGGDGNDSRPR